MMYRTHSQRILDTVISANFEEVMTTLTCHVDHPTRGFLCFWLGDKIASSLIISRESFLPFTFNPLIPDHLTLELP